MGDLQVAGIGTRTKAGYGQRQAMYVKQTINRTDSLLSSPQLPYNTFQHLTAPRSHG